ncbi:hypothetical protein EMCRGX_G007114 [Ephydatia muelleri]
MKVKKKQKQVTDLNKNLHGKELDAKRQRKKRLKFKQQLQKVVEMVPEVAAIIGSHNDKTPGRPRLEAQQPELLEAIVQIAFYGSAAHDRRRDEVIRSVKTLDALTSALLERGFKLSQSGLYLRLLPKNSSSIEGKRHCTTVPVKLIRAQNSAHAHHIDSHFCTATNRALESLASMLGPKEVFFGSFDDKARVPIGLSAAHKQALLIMHMEYKVALPDHDWVVAAKHKLIPSVYAAINIKPDCLGSPESITYSGPTYIAIRSPVIIVVVDGGPDENPRFMKTISVAIHNFKMNLDALFVCTNAPKRSAFNRVERRMAPLSRELAGLILSHDHYGTHLDEQGRTIDAELEKSNFRYAGETLAAVWNGMVIDQHPVIAEFIEPDQSESSCRADFL